MHNGKSEIWAEYNCLKNINSDSKECKFYFGCIGTHKEDGVEFIDISEQDYSCKDNKDNKDKVELFSNMHNKLKNDDKKENLIKRKFKSLFE